MGKKPKVTGSFYYKKRIADLEADRDEYFELYFALRDATTAILTLITEDLNQFVTEQGL